jgi:hypothetical protein
MSDIDQAIRRALSAEDAQALDRFAGNESLPDQILATFGGPFAFLNTVGWIAGFGVFGAAVWAGWRMLHASDLREMLLWSVLIGLMAAGLVMIKLWFWMELHRNATVREIKRLELQIAQLTARLSK